MDPLVLYTLREPVTVQSVLTNYVLLLKKLSLSGFGNAYKIKY